MRDIFQYLIKKIKENIFRWPLVRDTSQGKEFIKFTEMKIKLLRSVLHKFVLILR